MNMESLPFRSLALKPELVSALENAGFERMSPVQEKVIPLLLKKKNVLALAPTGTGKTLAYAVPILNELKDDGHVQAVILSPTVALLGQIKSVFESFTKALGFPSDAVKAIYSQSDFNRAKPDIVLITPELYPSLTSHYPVNELSYVILDEGDMIAFDGFASSFKALEKAKDRGQISFFSASLKEQDITRVKNTLRIKEVVNVRKSITNLSVSHHLINIKTMKKAEALDLFLKADGEKKTIAFVSKKEDLYPLKKELEALGRKALLLHGSLDKREIKNTMEAFKKEENSLLLASDYVSRGIDIPEVDVIVSIDLPSDSQYYFHRAGRAGRYDRPGDSYIFYCEDDTETVKRIKDLIRRGTSFNTYAFSGDSLKEQTGPYSFRNLGKKDRYVSEKLQKEIRHAVNLNRSKKVKPNYKKKVSQAVSRVKEKHRRKVVLTNIARSGGNVRDFHTDDKKPSKKKKTRS